MSLIVIVFLSTFYQFLFIYVVLSPLGIILESTLEVLTGGLYECAGWGYYSAVGQ